MTAVLGQMKLVAKHVNLVKFVEDMVVSSWMGMEMSHRGFHKHKRKIPGQVVKYLYP